MLTTLASGQVHLLHGGVVPRRNGLQRPEIGAHARPGGARGAERQQVLNAVHDALSAAMTADAALCRLRLQQALDLCTDRPHVSWAAHREIKRLLALDIVERHLSACEKRRCLQREMEALAARLRQIAAPEAT